MVNCEVCGKGPAKVKAIIEGAKFEVCETCAKHGKVVNEPSKKMPGQIVTGVKTSSAFKSNKKDINNSSNTREEIVEDYAEILRKEFNKSGKTYKEFANELMENESYMRKIIRGEMMPTISTAKKLEKKLGIKLIEEAEHEKINLRGSTSSDLTLADLVEIKRKK